MKPSEFDDLVRKKFAEFERQNGRVPTLPELAASLGVEERMLERKLRKALALMGTDVQTEGTSAFKSTLRQVLSKGLLSNETPVESDLQLLLMKARQSKTGTAEMKWMHDDGLGEIGRNLTVEVSKTGKEPLWTVWFENRKGSIVKLLEIETDLQEIDRILQVWRHEPYQRPYLNQIPRKQDLEILVAQAEKSRNNKWYQNFKIEQKMYRITVESAPPHDEYNWSLYVEDPKASPTRIELFNYVTADFQLVEDLLSTACQTREMVRKDNVIQFKKPE